MIKKMEIYKKVIEACCKAEKDFPKFSFSLTVSEYGDNLFLHIGNNFNDKICLNFEEDKLADIESIFERLKSVDLKNILEKRKLLREEESSLRGRTDEKVKKLEEQLEDI